MHESYYSDGRHERPARDPAQRKQAAAYLSFLRSDPPGGFTDNRLLQSQKFRGVPYVAIQAILDLIGSCTFRVARRHHRPVNKSLFLPWGGVVKALPGVAPQADDEAYATFADEDHPLPRIVARPNNEQTIGDVCGDVVLQNRLTGVGPLWLVPNRAGKPVELWALKTALTYPLYQVSRQYPQGAWRVTPYAAPGWSGAMPGGLSASGGLIPGDEVARFRERHPLIDWDGFSPLTAEADQLDILEAIDQSRWSAMTNGLQLDAVLTVPGIDEQDAERLSARVSQKAAGSRNARRFLVVGSPPGLGTGDKPNLQTFGTSPKDMDFANGWEQMVKFCLAVFGVPAAVTNLTETSYSEFYAAQRTFHHRQSQFVRRLAEFLTRHLAEPWSEYRGELKVQIDLPRVDDHELLEKQLAADAGIRSVNERRAVRGLEPVENGEYPEQIYLKVLEQDVAPQQQPGMPGGDGGQEDGGQDADPLAALLGGSATGGAAPAPDNDDAEGSLPPREVLKARQLRKEGEVWQVGARWYTKKNGKIRTAADPSKKKQPTKKEQAAQAKVQKQADAAKAKSAADKLAQGGKDLTAEEVDHLDRHFQTLTQDQMKAVARAIKAKVGGAKAELAKRLVEHARGLVAKKKESPVQADVVSGRAKLPDLSVFGGEDAPDLTSPPPPKPAAKKTPAKKQATAPKAAPRSPEQAGADILGVVGKMPAPVGGVHDVHEVRAAMPDVSDADFRAGLEHLMNTGAVRGHFDEAADRLDPRQSAYVPTAGTDDDASGTGKRAGTTFSVRRKS